MRHFGWFSNIVKRHKQGKVKQFNRFLWMKYTSENLNGKAYFDYFSISFWSSHLSIQIAPERSHRVLLQFNRSANIPASARSSLHCDAQRFPLQIQFTLKMDLDIQRFSDAQLLERHSCCHLETFYSVVSAPLSFQERQFLIFAPAQNYFNTVTQKTRSLSASALFSTDASKSALSALPLYF